MLNEVWKPIKYYEGLYEISNYGRVKSVERTVYSSDGERICGYVKEHYVPQHDNGRGYLFVSLWKDNKSKREYVHRLVALTFIDNPTRLPQVNHKDEDKQNNYVENLEWCDATYNNTYGTKITRQVATSEDNGVYAKSSERMRVNNPNKGQWKRGKNAYAKKVICDGIVFNCIKDCAEYYKVNYCSMRGWLCGSNKMPNYFVEHELRYVN